MGTAKGYHSKDKSGNPRRGENVDDLLDKIQESGITGNTITIGQRSINVITEHQSLDGYATEEWVEQQGYLTEHQDISGKANVGDSYTKQESDAKYSTKQELNAKQDIISDLNTIRTNAQSGANAYHKPANGIPASDLASGAIPDTSNFVEESDLAQVAFSGSYNDLTDTPPVPAAQVNSDWNATSGVAEILNKPTIPPEVTETTVANWGFLQSYTETDPTVSSWAKQPTKPTYTAQEVGALPDTTAIPTITFRQW